MHAAFPKAYFLLGWVSCLLDFKMDSIDPLLMIMIGHPDLGRRLQRPMFRNIHQRILFTYKLPPLDEAETKLYVCHHLKLAGAQPSLFTDSAYLALYKTSGGVCRLLNRFSQKLLCTFSKHFRQGILRCGWFVDGNYSIFLQGVSSFPVSG